MTKYHLKRQQVLDILESQSRGIAYYMNEGESSVIKLVGLGKFVSNGIHKAWKEGKYITRKKINNVNLDKGSSKWVVELLDKEQTNVTSSQKEAKDL
jgi:hypothetical protein